MGVHGSERTVMGVDGEGDAAFWYRLCSDLDVYSSTVSGPRKHNFCFGRFVTPTLMPMDREEDFSSRSSFDGPPPRSFPSAVARKLDSVFWDTPSSFLDGLRDALVQLGLKHDPVGDETFKVGMLIGC